MKSIPLNCADHGQDALEGGGIGALLDGVMVLPGAGEAMTGWGRNDAPPLSEPREVELVVRRYLAFGLILTLIGQALSPKLEA